MGFLASPVVFCPDKFEPSPTSGVVLHPLQEGGRWNTIRAVIHGHWKHVRLPVRSGSSKTSIYAKNNIYVHTYIYIYLY